MVIRIIGENCSRKSALANEINKALGGEGITGKDYLRLLPEGAVRILATAEIDTNKERFRMRMRGNLPGPVAQMLEKTHGMFDAVTCDHRFDGVHGDAAVCEMLKSQL